MAVIAPLITQMVIDGMINRQQARPVPVRRSEIALSALAAFLTAIGTVYLLVALHLYLAPLYAAPVAALLTALAALGAAVVAASTVCAMRAYRRRNQAKVGQGAEQTKDALLSALAAATEGLEEPIAQNPRTAVLLASLAGYVAGDKLH